MPAAGPKALASYSLLLTQRCKNELLHLSIALQKNTLTIWVWKIHLILSEGGIPLKQHLRQGRVKSLGSGSRKLARNAIVPGEKPCNLRESHFHGAHPTL